MCGTREVKSQQRHRGHSACNVHYIMGGSTVQEIFFTLGGKCLFGADQSIEFKFDKF